MSNKQKIVLWAALFFFIGGLLGYLSGLRSVGQGPLVSLRQQSFASTGNKMSNPSAQSMRLATESCKGHGGIGGILVIPGQGWWVYCSDPHYGFFVPGDV